MDVVQHMLLSTQYYSFFLLLKYQITQLVYKIDVLFYNLVRNVAGVKTHIGFLKLI